MQKNQEELQVENRLMGVNKRNKPQQKAEMTCHDKTST